MIEYSFMSPGSSFTADVYRQQLEQVGNKIRIRPLKLMSRAKGPLSRDNAQLNNAGSATAEMPTYQ